MAVKFGFLALLEAKPGRRAELPMPTVVIVDTAGTVRWLDIHPDYTTRSEPDAILNALEETSSQ